ncbi:expressed unknown protein [Seminavis robusta]|uniref:Peroxidase n=1 Tax=Seminavis robusta TaxID=568900 RepID=A0A9N8HPG9_9STRA|nr:expressed unknown protein [Seminavis robusta]|eukprot:Sro1087_g239920.1 n/a (97) ;mRNA; r:37504-37794
MGFTRKEIVALMGTHTLGAMAFEFSGFSAFLHEERDLDQSAWIGSNDAFDNGWYRFMLRVPWDKKETMVDDVTVIEWLFRDNTFLNSDEGTMSGRP